MKNLKSFFAGIYAGYKGYGYGYFSHKTRLPIEPMVKGWKLWFRLRHHWRHLKWKLHTGQIMEGKRSLLTGFKPVEQ